MPSVAILKRLEDICSTEFQGGPEKSLCSSRAQEFANDVVVSHLINMGGRGFEHSPVTSTISGFLAVSCG